jgi:hypothetical protein
MRGESEESKAVIERYLTAIVDGGERTMRESFAPDAPDSTISGVDQCPRKRGELHSSVFEQLFTAVVGAMRQAPINVPRQCGRCGQTFTAEQVNTDRGWTPVRSGWRCGGSGHAHMKRVNDLADVLLASHRRLDWAGTSEHTN